MTERPALDQQLRYWLVRREEAQSAVEYADHQIHAIRCAIGEIVVRQMAFELEFEKQYAEAEDLPEIED